MFIYKIFKSSLIKYKIFEGQISKLIVYNFKSVTFFPVTQFALIDYLRYTRPLPSIERFHHILIDSSSSNKLWLFFNIN